MHHTYTVIQDARRGGLASGYRYWFGFPVAFGTAPHGGMVPTGGIISTAEDMSRYLAMYQGGGRYSGQVVLSAAGIAEIMRPGPPQERGAFAGANWENVVELLRVQAPPAHGLPVGTCPIAACPSIGPAMGLPPCSLKQGSRRARRPGWRRRSRRPSRR
jgi:CubicO group peptidase (beta-lactamase class C family)